jgi:hypothetical protein
MLEPAEEHEMAGFAHGQTGGDCVGDRHRLARRHSVTAFRREGLAYYEAGGLGAVLFASYNYARMPEKTDLSERKYDKGERRFKHVGKGPRPYIEFDKTQPRKWVGKCPDTVPDTKKQELLNKAIAAPNGHRDVEYVKQLYVVHQGAIYEAQTLDAGRSYHAYPYKGRLSRSLLQELEAMAVKDDTVQEFKDWVGNNIEVGGQS